MPLVVDRLGPADLEAALRLSTQAGWNQISADWERLLHLSPQGCLAGRHDGRLIATATLASFGRTAHWIGMVLVDNAMRGRGFGSAMLSGVVELGRALGGIVGLDATDLGRPVYLKQGFADVAPIERWSGVLRSTTTAPGVEMIDRSSLDDVADLDREAVGADRTMLLQQLLRERDVFGVVERGSGFAFLRPGRAFSHVGPVIASDEHVCSRLLSRLAALSGGTPVLLDSLRSPSSSALLESHGLSLSRRLTRMTLVRGKPVLMGERVRAIVSFEWG